MFVWNCEEYHRHHDCETNFERNETFWENFFVFSGANRHNLTQKLSLWPGCKVSTARSHKVTHLV